MELDRIKRNVAKMASMNAPEGDIDGYIASEGATIEQVRNFQPSAAPVAPEEQESIPRTILEQGLQGATFGLGDEITDRIGAGTASLATDESYNDLLAEARGNTEGRFKRQFDQHPVTSVLSNIVGGVGTGLAGATTKGGAVLTKALTSGGLPARIAKGALGGAASGGLYGAGQAQEGERLEGAKGGAVGGTLLGGAAPAIGSMVRSAVLPKVSKAIQPLAKRAKEFGIPLSMDQVVPSRFRKTVQKVSQEIPFSGTEHFEDVQRGVFHKALAKTIGQDTGDLSPKTINRFRHAVGIKFDKALAGKHIKVDAEDLEKLRVIKGDARSSIETGLADIVDKNVDSALDQLKVGKVALSGEKLASIRSEMLKRATRAQGASSEFVSDIVDVIDNIADKNLSKGEVAALKEARGQWKNFKILQPLLGKSTTGEINPTQLLNRVNANRYIDASKIETGTNDLVDLARIGKEFLPKAGGSDTFQKTALGVTAAGSFFKPTTGAIIGSTMAGNRAMQGLNRSQALVNRAVSAAEGAVLPDSLISSVLSGQAGTVSNQRKRKKK